MKKNKLLEEIRKEIPTETRERVQREADEMISQAQYDPIEEMDHAVRGIIKGLGFLSLIMFGSIYIKTGILFWGIGFGVVFVFYILALRSFKKDEKKSK